jgi:hypothetical protein
MKRRQALRRTSLSGRRFSASVEASRAAELARVRAMSALERMELALALGQRRRALLALRAEEANGLG